MGWSIIMFEQLKADIKRALKSKKENDPQRLLKLLKDNPNQFLTIKEWSKIFKKPVPSTRRNLAGLEDNDVITRVGKKGSKGVKYGFKDVDTGVWYKKLLKTGTTKTTKWETSTKVEIFTYEQNDKCRYLSLMEAALKEMDYTEEIAETGYSSSRDSAGEFSPYQFESAFLKIESVKGGYTSFEEAVTLKDLSETPC